jgi:hypothetical protein
MAPAPARAGGPWTALFAGFALLALGAALARASLPEWRTGPIPPPAFFTARFREPARAIEEPADDDGGKGEGPQPPPASSSFWD